MRAEAARDRSIPESWSDDAHSVRIILRDRIGCVCDHNLINRKGGRGTDAYNERTARVHPRDLPVSFEYAGCHRTACESTAPARVIWQLVK